jgi:hypothetical protein
MWRPNWTLFVWRPSLSFQNLQQIYSNRWRLLWTEIKNIHFSYQSGNFIATPRDVWTHDTVYTRKKLSSDTKWALPEAYSANSSGGLKITENSHCTGAEIIHLRCAGRMRPTTPLHVAALCTSNLEQWQFPSVRLDYKALHHRT